MKISELIHLRKMICDTRKMFGDKCKEAQERFDLHPQRVILSVDNAEQIAECLDWMNEVIEDNFNNINLELSYDGRI